MDRWFQHTLTWKGLSLYARFDMGFDFQVYDSNIAFWLGEGQGAMAFNDDVRNTWTPDNPGAKYPRVVWASQFGTDNYIRTNSFFTQNGSYLACRELQLSYALPKSICEKLACQGVTVSVTGQNLGYIKSCTTHCQTAPLIQTVTQLVMVVHITCRVHCSSDLMSNSKQWLYTIFKY